MQNFRLEELLEEMLFNEKSRGISQKTIKKHQKFLKLFFEFLKKEQIYFIEDVTPKSIRQFMLMKLEEGCAETYVNSHLRSIRAYFKYCVDEDYIRYDRNPCMRVKWVKERKVIIQTFNDMEIKEMLKVAKKLTLFKPQKMDKQHTGYQTRFTNQRDYLLLLILVDTGLRINEVMNLKDVHITNKELFVENGKRKKDRIVHCSPLIYKEYIKYKRVANSFFEYNEIENIDNYVFLTREGKQYNYILAERAIIKIGNQCEIRTSIRVSPHSFRHYFAQKLVRNGTDIYRIQKLLGHASIKTTEVYLRSLNIEDEISKAVNFSPLQTL
ncbi:tyrosine-type recombinase/integrase [Enterococcus faecium]|uniref:tyrosine-type recombinase/integrase n=1 Tax=Enterococcus faecium TaxID=1352 RepID=UPI0020917AC1|nr:tyrosine-type recombinase/integrase [Enterococcus faecium]MCO5417981.1 tyrosine-type recombinase/integrase [Enterococcus faecium]